MERKRGVINRRWVRVDIVGGGGWTFEIGIIYRVVWNSNARDPK